MSNAKFFKGIQIIVPSLLIQDEFGPASTAVAAAAAAAAAAAELIKLVGEDCRKSGGKTAIFKKSF